jgi:hypothetical protein
VAWTSVKTDGDTEHALPPADQVGDLLMVVHS